MNAELLANRIWPLTGERAWLRNVVLAVLGSIFVALCAQVSIPMIPVPMTLQTLAVLTIGGAYGSRLGAATLALYALEGLAGLPVFAEFKAGPAVLMGPTGGYIVGFIVAAALVGWFAERGFDRNPVRMGAATLAGGAILYVPGLLWLAQFTGWAGAIEHGLSPFIFGDLIKAVLAALAFPAVWSFLGPRS